MKHRIIRMASVIRSINGQLEAFYKDYQDDSDEENNPSTNGYFPPRPSQEECAWLERRQNFVTDMTARLINEILKPQPAGEEK